MIVSQPACGHPPRGLPSYAGLDPLVEEFALDSSQPGEGMPHGVPDTVNWCCKGAVNRPSPPAGMNAATPWGLVYVDDSAATTAPNTRVELGHIELGVLTNSQGWLCYRWLAGNGAWYSENDYLAPHVPADQRVEPNGNTSITAGNGKSFHFFPNGQTAITRDDVIGITSTFRARLIVANPALPDDRASARYLAMAGADWWIHVGAQLNGDFSNAPQAANGRFKYVTNDWRTFRVSSVLPGELERRPPTCSWP